MSTKVKVWISIIATLIIVAPVLAVIYAPNGPFNEINKNFETHCETTGSSTANSTAAMTYATAVANAGGEFRIVPDGVLVSSEAVPSVDSGANDQSFPGSGGWFASTSATTPKCGAVAVPAAAIVVTSGTPVSYTHLTLPTICSV